MLNIVKNTSYTSFTTNDGCCSDLGYFPDGKVKDITIKVEDNISISTWRPWIDSLPASG